MRARRNDMGRLRSEITHDALMGYESDAEKVDPKAHRKFKSMNTDYGRKCRYDPKDTCNSACKYWTLCVHGKFERGGRQCTE
jgi:hypothetical protein